MCHRYVVIDRDLLDGAANLRDFAVNVFGGYPEGLGDTEEKELLLSFQYLVRDFIDLLVKTSKPFSKAFDEEIECRDLLVVPQKQKQS